MLTNHARLLVLSGAMNEVNPALNISDETIESLVSTFVKLREVLLSTSICNPVHLCRILTLLLLCAHSPSYSDSKIRSHPPRRVNSTT